MQRNLRPDDKPFHPAPFHRLPKIPRVAPAYTGVSIRPSQISKERHKEIGPRVLKRIYGPVNLDLPRLNARYPLRAAQQHQNASITVQPKRHDEFDFLSASPSRPFSDIPASWVSDIIEANVLMAPIEGPPLGDFEEVVIASDRLPDESESHDTSGREDEVSAVLADSGAELEGKEEGTMNGEMSFKGAPPQDADEGSDSENVVDGLV